MTRLLIATLLSTFGCYTTSATDVGIDAATDARDGSSRDSGVDAPVDSGVDVPVDTPIDAPMPSFRFRIGNALFEDDITVCLSDYVGNSVRVPERGSLARGEVSAWRERPWDPGADDRPSGLLRVSWLPGDVPLSEAFCAGEEGEVYMTSFPSTNGRPETTFLAIGHPHAFETCGEDGTEPCRFYGEKSAAMRVVAPLFASSPPRLRILNASTRGVDTFCIGGEVIFSPFNVPSFYQPLGDDTAVRAGVGECTDEVIFDWPFDPSGMADPSLYWTEPVVGSSAALVILDDGEGGLIGVPWHDADAEP